MGEWLGPYPSEHSDPPVPERSPAHRSPQIPDGLEGQLDGLGPPWTHVASRDSQEAGSTQLWMDPWTWYPWTTRTATGLTRKALASSRRNREPARGVQARREQQGAPYARRASDLPAGPSARVGPQTSHSQVWPRTARRNPNRVHGARPRPPQGETRGRDTPHPEPRKGHGRPPDEGNTSSAEQTQPYPCYNRNCRPGQTRTERNATAPIPARRVSSHLSCRQFGLTVKNVVRMRAKKYACGVKSVHAKHPALACENALTCSGSGWVGSQMSTPSPQSERARSGQLMPGRVSRTATLVTTGRS